MKGNEKLLCRCGCGQIADTKTGWKWSHWNIGRHWNLTQTTKNKLSIAQSEWQKTHDNPFKGKYHTEETKNKMKEKAIGRKSLLKNKTYEEIFGEIKAKEIRKKISLNHVDEVGKNNPMYGIHRFGKESPNWQGGISKIKYPTFFINVRAQIRKRDNYICQKCGITEKEHLIKYTKVLDVHHIDYDKENCGIFNLITLCHKCNMEANKNRSYYKIFYLKKVITIINHIKIFPIMSKRNLISYEVKKYDR